MNSQKMNYISTTFYVFLYDILINSFTRATGPLTIIAYPELSQDFLDFKFEFDSTKSTDPFFKKNTTSMKEDCQNVRDANLYKVYLVDESMDEYFDKTIKELGELTSQDLKIEKPGRKYEEKTVRIGGSSYDVDTEPKNGDNDKYRVNLFRCVSLVPDKFFYLSYGFHDELAFMYLFEGTEITTEKNEEPKIEFLGRIERKPTLYGNFQEVNKVKKVFLHIVNNVKGFRDALPVEEDVLCTLNANQQFRLCSLIYDMMITPTKRRVKIKGNSHRCMERKLVNLKENRNGNLPQYLIERFYSNIVACFDRQSPIFYLVADPSDQTAVFALKQVKKEPDADSSSQSAAEEYFVPIGLYQNISVLKYRKEVY